MYNKFSPLAEIPNHLLTSISGGYLEEITVPPAPSVPSVSIYGGGSEDGFGGTIALQFPLTETITLEPYMWGDSINGINGGGMQFTAEIW